MKAITGNTAFARMGLFNLLLRAVDDCYGNISGQLDIPKALAQEPMRLMPLSEMTRYASQIERLTGDEMFVAKAGAKIHLQHFSSFESLVASSKNLFTAMLRFNNLFANFQSGVTIGGRVSGKLLKWRYHSPFIADKMRLQDGVFACWLYVHILRLYHGAHYCPTLIQLPGSQIGAQGEMAALFGCEVHWHSESAQVWFPVSDISKLPPASLQVRPKVLVDQNDLLSFIDMPAPEDFIRCVYELINYCRCFAYPSLSQAAKILGLSEQKLQRQLQLENVSFSDLVQLQLLSDQALKLLSQKLSEADIARQLGFTNQQSFSKAFKRMHGLTPRQYQEQQS
ncbi:AraC family transcriptional regulator [Motilimonas pumila]|uniref:AraC family transcriptional regulator n=1 Tax=Motilimonas pumila TaxID=2303987 RepID=A0A418YIP6_9GAMM|nr:AraC family transcriptional regulator [Motilimonas pumila]RJG50518.1 AraC family transcriptional regulator [Motilimonas pumila]